MDIEGRPNIATDQSTHNDINADDMNTNCDLSSESTDELSISSFDDHDNSGDPNSADIERKDPRLPDRKAQKDWKKATKYYSEDYLRLFRNVEHRANVFDDGVPPADLEAAQVGAVTWLPSEKEKLFKVVSRRGRLDIPTIAASIGSKSSLEVQDYLMFLREQEAERHLYEEQTKAISHADIPAAVEVSQDCEVMLERAADAVATVQCRYDRALAKESHSGHWQIDRPAAQQIDEKIDEAEPSGMDDGLDSEATNFPADGLFHLDALLELSERIFMNPSEPRLTQNWHNIVSPDERPAMTCGLLSDLHQLAVGITRKLMQSAMFLALSRIRSSNGQRHRSKALVKEQDVLSALEVIGMKRDAKDYWIGVPRRNRLLMVHGSHDKGSHLRALAYEAVEKDLSEWRGRTRAGRSTSLQSEGSAGLPSPGVEGSEDRGEASDKEMSDEHLVAWESSPSAASSGEEFDKDILPSNAGADEDEFANDEYGPFSFHASTSKQKKVAMRLERAQDAHMKRLDKHSSEMEEARLWCLLGQNRPAFIKPEADSDLGRRPRVLRKAADDLEDWQGVYCADWELFGEPVPQGSFARTTRQSKKRKADADSVDEGEGEAEGASAMIRPKRSRNLPIRQFQRLSGDADSSE